MFLCFLLFSDLFGVGTNGRLCISSGVPHFLEIWGWQTRDCHPELFWRALGGLFSRNWITFGFVGLFALYHAVRLTLRSNHASIRLDLAGLFLAGIQLGFLLLVAKHPADHYLLPVVVSLSLSTALVVYTLDGMRNYWGWVAGFAVLCAAGLCLSLHKVASMAAGEKAAADAKTLFYEQIRYKYDSSLRADFYTCSSPEFALLFGDAYSGGHFFDLINKRFPNRVYFNIFESCFVIGNQMFTPEEIMRSHPLVYLHGAPQQLDPLKKDFPGGTRFTVLEYANGQAIIEVQAGAATSSPSLSTP